MTQHDGGTSVTQPHVKVCFCHVLQQTNGHSLLHVLMCSNTYRMIQIRELHMDVQDCNV